jgi:uncharacterized membrane protein
MADPGKTPDTDDHDDHVGFSSPRALQGVRREPRREPETPAWARETPGFAAAAAAPGATLRAPFGRRDAEPVPMPEGATGLFAVYALILFAVPTLGVSAVIALLAVFRQQPPADPMAASHFIYQKRTLYAAAAVALASVIMIIVSVGVFLLFLMALWVVLRATMGVFRLKAGQPISRPLGWWV